MEINVGDLSWNWSFDAVISVSLLAYNHILETHIVTCQCSSLIRKDMLDLSQLFIQSTSLHSHLRRFSCYEFRRRNVNSLDILHHLQSDNQRDGDEVSEE